MSMPAPYPLQLELHANRHITRWRPLVQWLLAIPHLIIAYALRFVRQALTLVSFFTVLFTEQIPRPLFDAIVMTYRYEWRAMSYAFFMHEDYPPFDFDLSSEDDGAEPCTSLRLTYPGHLERWQPLYKWFLAIPQYFVLAGLAIAACAAIIGGFFAVLFTGEYPEGHPGLPGQRLPLRAKGGGLRRLPHRPLPALQPRRVGGRRGRSRARADHLASPPAAGRRTRRPRRGAFAASAARRPRPGPVSASTEGARKWNRSTAGR